METPDIRSMTELEFTAYLHWLLNHDGAEPKHVVVPVYDLCIDIVLPAEPGGPIEVVGDDW